MNNVKNLCRDKGFTVSDLAIKIELHPQSLSRIISTGNTSDDTKRKIAEALGVTIPELTMSESDSVRSIIRPISDHSKWSVAKIIQIIAPTDCGEQHLGDIIYRRNLDFSYKLVQEENKDDSIINLFDEYPKQKNYPNDVLDELILDAVKLSYPQTRIRNKLIVFNTDIDHLNMLANRPSESVLIHISPRIDFTQAQHYAKNDREFVQFRFEFTVYLNFLHKDSIIKFFTSNYDLDKEKEIDRLICTLTKI